MYTNELKTRIQNQLLRTDGKSTNPWIYRTQYVKDNHLESLLKDVEEATPFVSNRLDERIYCILNDVDRASVCYCGQDVKFKRFQLGYAVYCSVKCRANDLKWQEQRAATTLKKYGVRFISQLPDERTKRSKLLKQRRPHMNTELASLNRKESIKRKYGDHYNSGWTERAIQTRISNGNMVPVEISDEYREYYVQVCKITKKQNLQLLPNIEKRGVLGKDIDAHHLDHMVSIYDGFMNNVPSTIIGHLSNLRCIPARDNIQKGNYSCISIEQLNERYQHVTRI